MIVYSALISAIQIQINHVVLVHNYYNVSTSLLIDSPVNCQLAVNELFLQPGVHNTRVTLSIEYLVNLPQLMNCNMILERVVLRLPSPMLSPNSSSS